ncbi:hypothetical protein PBI_NEBKISS_91 [Mycobacterium phage Nebkiss]|nr:hypothetical protein PBI_NEBKISS_91 [Mycobacterium phage Nebkiss]
MVEFRCRSGPRCVAKTTDGAALVSRDTLCHQCCSYIQSMLDELPKILHVLPAWKGGIGGESGEAKVSSSKNAPPCPLRVEIVDLECEIRAALRHIKKTRIVDLVNMQDGFYWAFVVRKLYEKADKAIGLTRHWSPRLAPCPGCEQRTLGNWAGNDIINCQSCGTVLPRDEYIKHTLQIVASQKGKPRK